MPSATGRAPGEPGRGGGTGVEAGAEAPYLRLADAERSRLLSLQDREPFSPTYGCFDRTFWAWKFTDFPAARFQEALFALADGLARGHDLEPPARGRLEAWLGAGFRFWRSIQYADGSFDEAYPYERSLAATAFTGFYVGEAYLRAGDVLPPPEKDALRATFARAGAWLERNDERHGVLSNHLAAAAAALDVIARVTGEERFARRSRHFLARVLAHQSREGWYEEYGGADPGYQLHATFFLARLWQSTRDAALLESLRRSLAFLKHFVHLNGTVGGAYGSRNTTLLFPAGLEILAPHVEDAAAMAAFLRGPIARGEAPGLLAMDAWNYLPMLNGYLFAAAHAGPLALRQGALPCEQEGEWLFPDAGLLVKGTRRYHAVVGLAKGGTVQVHDRAQARLVLADCGFWADLGGGRTASSQGLLRPARFTREGSAVAVEAPFTRVNQRRMTPLLFLGFRVFSLTLGRLARAAYALKRLLVEVLVRRRREEPIRLRRRVVLGAEGVLIRDEVTVAPGTRVLRLVRGARFAAIHMGSSRYFEPQELAPPPDSEDLAPHLARGGMLSSEVRWGAVGAEERLP